MKWIEVSIKTTTEAVEAVSNILYESGITGVVIEDPNDFTYSSRNEGDWDYVDESVFHTHFEGAIVKGYLPESSDLIDKIELIRQSVHLLPQYGLDIGLGELTTIEVNEEDWSTSWKKYYKPVKIGNKIVIKPTWESYQAREDETVIEMDPGMAFGTGTHETTMMCILELEKTVREKDTVFDIGCGSGILSIAAAKLGAHKVIAIDLDEVAVDVTRKNITLNNIEGVVETRHGNLTDVLEEKANVIVANIIADVIILLSRNIRQFLVEEGIFIASGIILDKIDKVKENLQSNGLEIQKVETMGEWAVIVSRVQGEKKYE